MIIDLKFLRGAFVDNMTRYYFSQVVGSFRACDIKIFFTADAVLRWLIMDNSLDIEIYLMWLVAFRHTRAHKYSFTKMSKNILEESQVSYFRIGGNDPLIKLSNDKWVGI